MKKILKTTYHTTVIVLFLAIAVAGFTQTKTFRSYLRNLVLAGAQEALNGTLEFGPLEGNLVTGLRVGGLRLQQDGVDVLSADRLEARYDLWAFFTNRISLRRVTLVRPRISLWRTEAGPWNVDQLLRRSEPDSQAVPWSVDIKNAELLDATVSIVDSLALRQRNEDSTETPTAHAIDYARVRLHSVTLRTAVRMQNSDIAASVKYFGFQSRDPDFTLENLSGDFILTPDETSVKNLMVKTKGSKLRLDAALQSMDITAIKSLRQFERAPVRLTLNVDRLDLDELKQFLPRPLAFLDKTIAFDLQVSGAFGRLHVDQAVLRTPGTFVKIRGWVTNLHQPALLELDLAGEDNIIHPGEALELLPGLHLPDLRPLGVINCNVSFAGRTNNFRAHVDANLSSGRIVSDALIDLRGQTMIYDASVITENLNVARLFSDRTLESALNLNVAVKGSGTLLRSMTTVVRAEVDSSAIFGLPVRHSVAVLDIADKTVRSRVSLQAGHTRIDLTGRTTFHANDSTSYLVNGTVNSLNLAEILRNQEYESDLSFGLSLEGSGIRYADMQSTLTLEFGRSQFRTESFESRSLTLEYDASDSLTRTFTLRSDIADVAVVGAFTPPDVISTIGQTGALLANAIAHRFEHLDSLRTASSAASQPVFRHSFRSLPSAVDAKLRVHVKDFLPLGVLLGSTMRGAATLEASLHGSMDDLRLNGTAEIDRFFFMSRALDLDLAHSSLTFDLSNLRRVRTLESLHSKLVFQAERLIVDSLLLNGVQFTHRLVRDSSNFTLSTLVDSLLSVDLDGTSQFRPHRIHIMIPRLSVRAAEQNFANENPLHLVYGQDGFLFQDLSLRHETEAVALAGLFSPSGVSDIRFSVENFLLSNLKSFSGNPSFVERVKDFGGIMTLSGTFSGNTNNPRFSFDLSAQGTRVGDVVFGQILTRGSYGDGLSNVFVEFRNRPSETGTPPDLLLSGTMPVKIGSAAAPPSQDMDLSITSRGFRLEFLDPFIPIMSNLTGTLVCDVNIRGTLAVPRYEGSLAIQNARFTFTPLGIPYVLDGKLEPRGQNIALQNFLIRNTADDQPDGLMNISGTFTLEGLEIKEFDLQTDGSLKVMKEETSRRTAESMYGDIVASTGVSGLHWFGTPDRSFARGDLFIKNANLTFPPTRDSFLERSRTVTVSFVNDTARTIGEDARSSGGKSLASTIAGIPDSEPAPTSPVTLGFDSPNSHGERSFLDNIVYNLNIQTQGLTQIRFVFNAFTNEELFADLKGRLVFTKDREDVRLTGELEVGNRSYYKYFKSLQASGKLLFTGSPSNPELDILAKYDGTYRPDTSALSEQRVTVTMEITGTRSEPKVKMGLERKTRDGEIIPVKDVSSDAIAFLISGTFRDEMTQAERRNLVTTSLVGSIGSSLLSGPLTEIVRKEVGFVSSLDVLYYGGGPSQSFLEGADIRITGEVGDAVIRFGGRVLVNPTNVSIQLPMSSILGSEAWRNLIFELERRVEGEGENAEQRRDSNGIRLLYRITF